MPSPNSNNSSGIALKAEERLTAFGLVWTLPHQTRSLLLSADNYTAPQQSRVTEAFFCVRAGMGLVEEGENKSGRALNWFNFMYECFSTHTYIELAVAVEWTWPALAKSAAHKTVVLTCLFLSLALPLSCIKHTLNTHMIWYVCVWKCDWLAEWTNVCACYRKRRKRRTVIIIIVAVFVFSLTSIIIIFLLLQLKIKVFEWQSRAEQSRAEQSKAKQCIIQMCACFG